MAGFLQDKVVAVTGGGGGIGRAVALAAAAAGARVLVADYGVSMAGEDPSSEVAEAVAAEIRGRAAMHSPWPTTSPRWSPASAWWRRQSSGTAASTGWWPWPESCASGCSSI